MAVAIILFTTLFSTASGDIYFYHNDPFGNPVTITDSDGKVVWKTDDIQNNTLFNGQIEIDETGLIFDGSRYFDPEIGRYLTPDRKTRNHNPYFPKLDDQMKYTNLITKRKNEITVLNNNPSWRKVSTPIWLLKPINLFRNSEPNQNNKIVYTADILNPISIMERSRRMITNRLHGLL